MHDLNQHPAWSERIIKTGGVLLGMAGVSTIGAGLQLLTQVGSEWWGVTTAAVILTVGLLSTLTAPHVVLGRSWAAVLAVPIALAMGLVMVCWAAWSSLILFLSPLTVLAAIASSLAAVATPFTVPGAIRVSEARRILYA